MNLLQGSSSCYKYKKVQVQPVDYCEPLAFNEEGESFDQTSGNIFSTFCHRIFPLRFVWKVFHKKKTNSCSNYLHSLICNCLRDGSNNRRQALLGEGEIRDYEINLSSAQDIGRLFNRFITGDNL